MRTKLQNRGRIAKGIHAQGVKIQKCGNEMRVSCNLEPQSPRQEISAQSILCRRKTWRETVSCVGQQAERKRFSTDLMVEEARLDTESLITARDER